jgi:hypothetical protein
MKKDGQLYYLEDLSSVNWGKTMTWIKDATYSNLLMEAPLISCFKETKSLFAVSYYRRDRSQPDLLIRHLQSINISAIKDCIDGVNFLTDN